MPEFTKDIVKLELWWNHKFPTDIQLDTYMGQVQEFEEESHELYTMDMLFGDIMSYIFNDIEVSNDLR